MSEAYSPQRVERILHQAVEEVLGEEGLNLMLGVARTPTDTARIAHGRPEQGTDSSGTEFAAENGRFSPSRLDHILAALEETYGQQAGRGLALRIGRSCFEYGLREYGETLGVTSMAFRLLPLPAKLSTFAQALAGWFNSATENSVRVEERAGKLLWTMERCPLCRGRHADQAICLFAVGLAEESLYWLSGGKIFHVEEVGCIARGDPACVLQVDETPLS